MSVAGPNDIGFFLSGGSSNSNPFNSTGGVISNTRLTTKTFNNLWTNVSERQVRYGFKDIRIIYLKNMHSTLTFKNMRVYWNESDNFTTMQIGRSGVNGTENTTISLAAMAASDEPVPPSLWYSVIAVDAFRIVQDFNNTAAQTGHGFSGNHVNGSHIGVHVLDTSAAIFNQKIARFTAFGRRQGTPSGDVFCRVWDEAGNVKATIGSVDSSTLSTGTGNFSNIVFTNQNNQYVMQVGDIIGLDYPGAGEDEGEGSQEDYLVWASWDWAGGDPSDNPDNQQFDIIGTDEWHKQDGQWSASTGAGQSDVTELVYRAEIFGPEVPGGGGGGPCEPDPGGGDPGDPGNPPPPQQSGFIIMQDFTDLSAQTGYQVGIGAPNNTFRQAASIDGTNSPLLFAPVARITFLLRRVGNPTGTVSCRIWTSSGVVMATLGQVEVTNLTNQAGQWTQVPFTLQNNSYTMKVGDLIGVEFVTGNNTDHVIAAGWTWASTAAAAAEGEVGETAAATDKFGTRYIYANSGNFDYDWEIPSNSDSMRWDNGNPPINMEMTAYFMKSSPSSDTVSCKIRGGKHTDSAPNDGCCYILQYPCTGGTMEFQIECPHPNNHDCSTSGIDGTALSLAQWHGYKVAVWNVGTSTVHMEAWQDKGNNSGSTPLNQWEKVQVHDDSNGSCGNISNPLFKPKGSTSQCTFRIDNNSGTAGKWLSLVEIQPGGEVPPDGGGNPPSPPGAKDIPGTSIRRWNGTVWIANDGGMSDLVFKAERFAVLPPDPNDPNPPQEDPIIIDPGTKRKPTSYDQGIVFPPLDPGKYHALILERLIPPDIDEIGQDDVEQQIVAEIDATTEVEQPQDPGNPPPQQPPPNNPPPTNPPPTNPPPTQPPPSGQLGPYASTGKQLSASTRRATRHYASGKPDDETVEKNTDNISYQHYQCVYYVTMHGIEHDDTVSVKYGGTHMGTGWFDHSISFEDGQSCMGYEEDHPTTHSCVIEGPSYGSIIEKRIGICGVYRKQANLCELWINAGTGGWVKAISSNDVDGFDPGNDGDDEAQLRIDGFDDGDDPTIDTAVVQEIAPA